MMKGARTFAVPLGWGTGWAGWVVGWVVAGAPGAAVGAGAGMKTISRSGGAGWSAARSCPAFLRGLRPEETPPRPFPVISASALVPSLSQMGLGPFFWMTSHLTSVRWRSLASNAAASRSGLPETMLVVSYAGPWVQPTAVMTTTAATAGPATSEAIRANMLCTALVIVFTFTLVVFVARAVTRAVIPPRSVRRLVPSCAR